MADTPKASDDTADKREKRRLRQAPTIREQADKAAKKAEKSQNQNETVAGAFARGFALPFRKVGRALAWVSRFIIPPYFRNSWKELRQVTWPTLRESRRMTTAVIMFAVAFGLIVALLDFLLGKLFKEILLR